MRQLLASTFILGTLLGTGTAVAQPVTQPEGCGVTFVRASEEARTAIETYLRAEPQCTTSLALRVVETDGGYYLFAQRPDGRFHERVVPDLQSAGVLVASWIADDWIAPPSAPAPAAAPPPAARPAFAAPVAAPPPTPVGAPGATSVVATAPPRDTTRHRWFTLGYTLQPDGEGSGARFEADVMASGPWRLGGVLTYSERVLSTPGGDWMYANLPTRDIQAIAQLSRTLRWGRWELRAALGAGIINTEVDGWVTSWSSVESTQFTASGTFAVGEASALLTRRIGSSWGVGLGPVLTLLSETFADTNRGSTMERSAAQVELFGGLRYEL